MMIGLAALVVAVMLGLTLVKEPQGGLRNFYKLLFGFAFTGDGSEAPNGLQKTQRMVITAGLVGVALYFFFGALKSL